MKVRFSTPCAGGCGRVLVVGQQAQRRHRTLWCAACALAHQGRCTACAPTRTVPVPAAPAQPTLWT